MSQNTPRSSGEDGSAEQGISEASSVVGINDEIENPELDTHDNRESVVEVVEESRGKESDEAEDISTADDSPAEWPVVTNVKKWLFATFQQQKE